MERTVKWISAYFYMSLFLLKVDLDVVRKGKIDAVADPQLDLPSRKLKMGRTCFFFFFKKFSYRTYK